MVIKVAFGVTALFYITQNQNFLRMLILHAQVVERNPQRFHIAVVTVVDYRAVVVAFLQFKAHSDWLNGGQPLHNGLIIIAKDQHQRPNLQGVFNRSLVGKRNLRRKPLIVVHCVNGGACWLIINRFHIQIHIGLRAPSEQFCLWIDGCLYLLAN